MKPFLEVLRILSGVVLTLGTSLCLGRIALIPVQRELTALERTALGFVLGSGCLSLLVLFMGAWGLVGPIVYVTLGAISFAVALRFRQRLFERGIGDEIALPRMWRRFPVVVAAVYAGIYFLHALAPEVSPDGASYHLALVSGYLRDHRIGPFRQTSTRVSRKG